MSMLSGITISNTTTAANQYTGANRDGDRQDDWNCMRRINDVVRHTFLMCRMTMTFVSKCSGSRRNHREKSKDGTNHF